MSLGSPRIALRTKDNASSRSTRTRCEVGVAPWRFGGVGKLGSSDWFRGIDERPGSTGTAQNQLVSCLGDVISCLRGTGGLEVRKEIDRGSTGRDITGSKGLLRPVSEALDNRCHSLRFNRALFDYIDSKHLIFATWTLDNRPSSFAGQLSSESHQNFPESSASPRVHDSASVKLKPRIQRVAGNGRWKVRARPSREQFRLQSNSSSSDPAHGPGSLALLIK